MRSGPAPCRRIAAMKSLFRIVSVSARATRAYGRPRSERDGDDRVLDARAESRHERQREDEPREGEEHVGHPHEDRVDPAAEIAGGRADEKADRRDDHHDEADDHQRDARAVEHARVDVAPELVRPEPVTARSGAAGARRGPGPPATGRSGAGRRSRAAPAPRVPRDRPSPGGSDGTPSQLTYAWPRRAWVRDTGVSARSQARHPGAARAGAAVVIAREGPPGGTGDRTGD